MATGSLTAARIRERPRVVLAKLMAVAALTGVGVGFGLLVAGDDPEVHPRTAAELDRAERAAGLRGELLRRSQGQLGRVGERAKQLERRTRALERRNRRLRRALARARRASGPGAVAP